MRPVSVLVLDTNVVFDWLVFDDPGSRAAARAIMSEAARWIATAAMRQELEHVLAHGALAVRVDDAGTILSAWDRWATVVDIDAIVRVSSLGPLKTLQCSDPDDQKFLDLALLAGASALLSRDRALLKLASRARRVGLQIERPADWAAPR